MLSKQGEASMRIRLIASSSLDRRVTVTLTCKQAENIQKYQLAIFGEYITKSHALELGFAILGMLSILHSEKDIHYGK